MKLYSPAGFARPERPKAALLPISLLTFALAVAAATALPAAEAAGQTPSTALGRVLYADDFRTEHRWREGSDGACKTSYGEGGFVVEDVPPPGSCEFDLVQAGYFRGDVRIEIAARLRKGELGGTFGLKFGRASEDNQLFHTFTISASGTFDLAMNDGDWRQLIPRTADPAVQKGYGAENRLAVEIRGRSIRCYLNGKLVGASVSSADIRGSIGLYVDLVGMEAVFSDLRVTELLGGTPGPVAGRVLFEDDFISKHVLPVGTASPCKTGYVDAGFTLEDVASEGTCEFTLVNAGVLPPSVRIEVTLALQKGSVRSAMGLKFGKPAADNHFFYTLMVNADGSYRLSVWDGEWKYPIDWAAEPVLKKGYGAPNKLAVEIHGRNIRCFVNDKFIGSAAAANDLRGEAGLFLARPGMEAVFNHLRVVELPSQ